MSKPLIRVHKIRHKRNDIWKYCLQCPLCSFRFEIYRGKESYLFPAECPACDLSFIVDHKELLRFNPSERRKGG